MTSSRFITCPDIVKNIGNYTVLLVDADLAEIINLATFCSISQREYDIYLYAANKNNLEWLNKVVTIVDYCFVKDTSQIIINNSSRYLDISNIKTYFEDIDQRKT